MDTLDPEQTIDATQAGATLRADASLERGTVIGEVARIGAWLDARPAGDGG